MLRKSFFFASISLLAALAISSHVDAWGGCRPEVAGSSFPYVSYGNGGYSGAVGYGYPYVSNRYGGYSGAAGYGYPYVSNRHGYNRRW